MGREIERKFLLLPGAWRPDPAGGIRYRQGYLSSDPDRVVRVRTAGDRAYLTIKGRTSGITRSEFEYPIPLVDANALLANLCEPPLIEKTRYLVPYEGRTWEIDVFEGDNAGLVLAEVELPDEAAALTLPPWAGREVSDDPRYFNSNLARDPWTRWGHAG